CAMLTVLHTSMDASVMFFFSSRRRHTRSKRDWSSDVCSSDLSSNRAVGRERGCPRPIHGTGPVVSIPVDGGDERSGAVSFLPYGTVGYARRRECLLDDHPARRGP